MRAVIADQPGAPDVLRPVTLPDPEPGEAAVRVTTKAAAITFVETLIRAGSPVAPPTTAQRAEAGATPPQAPARASR